MDRSAGSQPLNAAELLESLRQRHIFRLAAAYCVAAWLVIQVVATIGPAFDLPDWVLRLTVVVSVAGFLATLFGFALVRRGAARKGMPAAARVVFAAAIVVALIGGVTLLAYRGLIYNERIEIAVLPFDDLSPKRDKAYLAEGVAEQILSSLGKVDGLDVVGRTTARELKQRAGNAKAIRADFGITHLLEGSVRSAGAQLRLSVRLVDTSDGTETWSEEFTGTADNPFALQDRVAAAVAARLRLAGSVERTAETQQTGGDAYQLYLAARQTARSRTEPELKKALALARRSAAADPKFAPGQALVGQLVWMLSDAENAYGDIPQDKARRIAAAYARRAIALAPDRAEGYAVLGLFEDESSLAPLHRAIALDPSWSEPRMWLALALDSLERHEESIAALRQAAAIDPLFPAVISRLSINLAFTGRFAEAKKVIDRFETQGGPANQVARIRGTTAFLAGDLSQAVAQFEKALRIDPATPYVAGYRERALAWMGYPVEVNSRGATVRKLYVESGPQAVADWAARVGHNAWRDPDIDILLFNLAAAGRFDLLRTYYSAELRTPRRACSMNGQSAVAVLVGLQRLRHPHASPLMACLTQRFAKRRPTPAGFRTYAIQDAQLAALRGDRKQALRDIEQEIRQGWGGWGKYTTRLAHFAAFEALLDDPQLPALQARIDSSTAREAREFEEGK